ncbi:hypothetical protein CEUSTIGMA_g10140.t1 [Chlamydomonas eustigma]|uniref:Exostosin GT47 domain-containing protein n=1 Tax=Chlamydomonas eustigma TaxID=1157962 RepID=A0A250XI09_9CHLO|nr:hypothetical protein CEUSTIGMA_g10140.t1 [Chlamydomonas eustigma]|eukprot:GAX82714.1 hypothetical protein CEUSTIGMA_g10140.t1 [Chlamydomonas eustigma]
MSLLILICALADFMIRVCCVPAEEKKTVPRTLPRIYLYPEDPQMMRHRPLENLNVTFYGLDVVLYNILKTSSHMVLKPEDADYFYLPVYVYWSSPPVSPEAVVAHLRKSGPWFDRKNGADHIFAVSGDFGRCEWGGWTDLRHSILVHHFGKVYNGNVPSVNPCNPLKNWGAACDPMLAQFLKIHNEGMEKGYQPCHFLGQDIVVPPTPWEHPERTRYLNPAIGVNRTSLAFFAGPINREQNPDEPWENALYSFGARQMFVKMLQGHPGAQIFEKHVPDYNQRLFESIFCLAAAGWGWGGRMKFSIMHGCIPIIVQDGIMVEFEEQLPLQEYAIRVPLWLMHKLSETLDVLARKGVVAKLQKTLECVWRLHWWSAPHGRAFDLLMCELERRLTGYKGAILDAKSCTLTCGVDSMLNIVTGEKQVKVI